MTLYLYGGPKTRVSMPKWYLAEKEISYEYVNIDLAARQNLAASYLEVNPLLRRARKNIWSIAA